MDFKQEQKKLQEELKKHLKESKISEVSINNKVIEISFLNGTDIIKFKIEADMWDDFHPILTISKEI